MSFMTFRLAVVIFVLTAPLYAHAEPPAELSARAEAAAAASSAQAVASSLAREDAALQRAIDRKVEARMAAALAPPRPARMHGASIAASPAGRTASDRRALYAVK